MISQELYDECLRDALAEQQEFIKSFKPGLVTASLGPGWYRHQLMKRNMKVKESIRIIRGEITELHAQVDAKLKQISDLENQCQHSWTEPICGNYSHRWDRGCTNCGKIDTIYVEDCNQVVFHFNKASITDSKIPMWVVKAKGQTYYVNLYQLSYQVANFYYSYTI